MNDRRRRHIGEQRGDLIRLGQIDRAHITDLGSAGFVARCAVAITWCPSATSRPPPACRPDRMRRSPGRNPDQPSCAPSRAGCRSESNRPSPFSRRSRTKPSAALSVAVLLAVAIAVVLLLAGRTLIDRLGRRGWRWRWGIADDVGGAGSEVPVVAGLGVEDGDADSRRISTAASTTATSAAAM